MKKVPKKWLFIGILAIAGIILLLIFATRSRINSYNSYAANQRKSINYCEIDSDCIVQSYYSKTCGSWRSCFNKNEKPLSDIGFGPHPRCDYPATACKCVNGKCFSI